MAGIRSSNGVGCVIGSLKAGRERWPKQSGAGGLADQGSSS